MSAIASISFSFDGTRSRFDQIYEVVCKDVADVALDIGTHLRGRSGAIEFIVDDYAKFEAKIAQTSAALGLQLNPANALWTDQEDAPPGSRT